MAQQPSGKLQVPLMILAFASVAGFVWWLSANTQPTQFAVATESASQNDQTPEFSLEAFSSMTADLEGQAVRIESVSVASVMSAQTFWFELDNGTPYLVRIAESVLLDRPLVVGDRVSVTGAVLPMSAEVLDQWEATGVISDPVARQMAEFAMNFLQAGSVSILPEGEFDPEA